MRALVSEPEASMSMNYNPNPEVSEPEASINADENFEQGDIRAFFKRAGRTEIKEVEPVYLEEPITTSDDNGTQIMTMMRGKMEKCRKRQEVLEKRQKRLMKRKMASKSHMGEKNLVQDDRNLVVTGADVEGLYPSLSDIEAAIIVYEAIMNSGNRFESINYHTAGKYVAMHMTEE
jgi:hypothetical protein